MMPTNNGETLYERYTREAEIDRRIIEKTEADESAKKDTHSSGDELISLKDPHET